MPGGFIIHIRAFVSRKEAWMEQSPERQSEHVESPIAKKSHHAPAADAKERIEEVVLIAKCTPAVQLLAALFTRFSRIVTWI